VVVEAFDFRVYFYCLLQHQAVSVLKAQSHKSKALYNCTQNSQTHNTDLISAADALFLSVLHFVFKSEKTLSGMHTAMHDCDFYYQKSRHVRY